MRNLKPLDELSQIVNKMSISIVSGQSVIRVVLDKILSYEADDQSGSFFVADASIGPITIWEDGNAVSVTGQRIGKVCDYYLNKFIVAAMTERQALVQLYNMATGRPCASTPALEAEALLVVQRMAKNIDRYLVVEVADGVLSDEIIEAPSEKEAIALAAMCAIESIGPHNKESDKLFQCILDEIRKDTNYVTQDGDYKVSVIKPLT